MKLTKKIIFKILSIIIVFGCLGGGCWLNGNMDSYAFAQSKYEIHHIFPQRYFHNLGDNACFELREFEHSWVEFGGGYKAEWDHLDGILATYNDDGEISDFGMRAAAYCAGSRILSYHLFVVDYNTGKQENNSRSIGGLTAWHFDFWSNIYYNLSYIFSFPAKLIHFWLYIIFDNRTFYGEPSIIFMIGWSIFQVIIGLIQAIVMLFIGPVIGLISHPLISLSGLLISSTSPLRVNLISSILYLIASIIMPLIHILFWTMF